MKPVNTKISASGSFDDVIQKVTMALAQQGFGVLSRIDFHSKIKEKLNEVVDPTVILGACHPGLALQAYRSNSDVTSLMPCNVVIRQMSTGAISVEAVSAEAMLSILPPTEALANVAKEADRRLKDALKDVAS